MEWSASHTWWVLAGVLVAAELATGTLYLLMLALGCAAGALAAHAGAAGAVQIVVGAVVGAGTTLAWHLHRGRRPAPPPSERNRDVQIDIGQRVHVAQWAADGSARVHYRGSAWSARWAGDGPAVPGDHVIVALDGNELRLAPRNAG